MKTYKIRTTAGKSRERQKIVQQSEHFKGLRFTQRSTGKQAVKDMAEFIEARAFGAKNWNELKSLEKGLINKAFGASSKMIVSTHPNHSITIREIIISS